MSLMFPCLAMGLLKSTKAFMLQWLKDVRDAVFTVAHGLWITLLYWIKTYDKDRKTFTEHFEYPELPVPVTARYRGFHRFDLTTCIALRSVRKSLPRRLHLHRQRTSPRRQRLQNHRLHDRLLQVHVLCACAWSLARSIASSWARRTT